MNVRWRGSIAFRLLGWFLALSIVPLLLVSLYSYQNGAQSINEMQRKRLEETAYINVRFVSDWFGERGRDLQHWSESSATQEFLLMMHQRWQESGKSLESFTGSMEYQGFLNVRDDALVRLSENYAFVYDLFLIDLEGNVLYTVAKESDLGTNLVYGPYATTRFAQAYRATLLDGNTHFSDLEQYEPSGGIIVGFLLTPMRDEAGTMIGVMALQLKMDAIFDQLAKINGGNAEVRHYLVGPEGLLRTKLSQESEVLHRRISTEQFWKWYDEHGLFGKFADEMNEHAFVYTGPDGEKVLGQHHSLEIFGIRWAHISEIDEEVVLEAPSALARQEIIIVIVVIVAVVVIALLIARRLTRPIYRLAETSLAYVNGVRDLTIPVESDDELGRLSQAFNLMLEAQKRSETDLKTHAAEAIRALEQLKEQKFALDAHAIVAITDVQGTIRLVNEKFEQISGYSQKELIGHNHRMLNSGTHTKVFWKEMYARITHGEVWHAEVCNRAKNGSLYWVDTTIVPFMGDDHKPESYIAIRTDITARKEAEKELHKALKLQKAIFDNAGVGIIMSDVNGIVNSVNAAACEMLGYHAEELEGNHASLIYSHDGLTSYAARISEELGEKIEPGFEVFIARSNRGLINNHEWSFVRKDGSMLPIYLTVTALQQIDGTIYGYMAIATDFSAHKEAQELTIAAKEAAEASARAKSEFLAAMSHEIRTPMNGVMGMLGLLAHSQLNETQRHHLYLAQSSAQSLLALINDILDFSKVEAGKMELETIRFDLREELDDLIEAMAIRAHEKGLELVLDTMELTQSVLVGDPGRIRQIVTNLVSNAIKFTHQGHIAVSAASFWDAKGNGRVRIEVADTGIGIAPEKIGMLFESFTQADSSTTRKYGGSGLGLAIVKKLAHLMGGTVRASSTLGKGSTFILEFAASFEPSEPPSPPIPVEGKRALIVDENAIAREVIRERLMSWGMVVEECGNVTEVLERGGDSGDQDRPCLHDIALIQYRYAGDLERVRQLRARCPQMKLVAMPSIGMAIDTSELAAAGFNSFFLKPTITRDLIKAVRTFAPQGEMLLSDTAGSNAQAAAAGTLKWPENTRILLVEDNATNQIVAQGILEMIGLEADVAANGLEAISALKMGLDTVPYTLVLMDCQMPEMDGFEATSAIRSGAAGEENRQIAIIAMTANAMAGDREKCLISGMDDYLAKPIHQEGVWKMLRKWIFGEESNTALMPDAPASEQKGVADDAANELWNEAAALERMGGNHILLGKIVESFLSESPGILEAYRNAVDRGDVEEARLHAHSLKGSSGNIGASRLQEWTRRMEMAAKMESLSVLEEGMEELDTVYEATIRILKDRTSVPVAPVKKKKRRFDPLEMAVSLQTLRNRIEKGEAIDPTHENLFGEYSDEEFNNRMQKLRSDLEQGSSEAAMKAIDTILAEMIG